MNKTLLSFLTVFIIASLIITGCKKDNNNENPCGGDNVLCGSITEDKTLTADVIWELDGKVFVESGATLTIEPGTIIKGREGTGTAASALVIARGGKINAVGTADKPIIFTSILDNIEIGQKTGTNLGETDREKWGGVILLGKAPISGGNGDTETQIEGIPADEGNGTYGGSDPADNSGTLKYVSIRHGGAVIGEGNEINGLTVGGVGSGTTIDHIEVVATLDDGIEFFGGTVNISNFLVTYEGDDAFDIDQNYAGTLSNIYAIHGGDTDNALEIDGPEGSTYTDGLFTVKNGTFISKDGSGQSVTYKSKAQGMLKNCFFSGYTKWQRVRASFDEENGCAPKSDAYSHYTDGTPTLKIMNNTYDASGTLADLITAYTDFTDADACPSTAQLDASYETAVDSIFSAGANGNMIAASPSGGGADKSVFLGWTWTDVNNKW